MDSETPIGGCQCELCHPNLYLGWNGDYTTEQPDTAPPPEEDEPVASRDKVPVLAN